jgi:SAM-dependent methyltransferase
MSDVQGYLPVGVKFLQGSVENLSALYKDVLFDAVICQHVFEHLLYPTALAGGIYSILRPGGQAFIETPNWTRMIAPFSHLFFWADYTHVRPFSRRTMHRLLSDEGFRILLNHTVSSTNWSVQLHPWPGEVGKNNTEGTKNIQPQFRPGMSSRVFSRLVNPLLKDILIVIVQKP